MRSGMVSRTPLQRQRVSSVTRACALEVGSSEGQSVTARAIDGDTPLCVLGRFGIPEFLNEGDRLRTPLKRVGKVLRELEWMEALDCVAEQLKPYRGKRFAFVCDTTSTLEDRHVFKMFTEQGDAVTALH